MTRFTQVMTVWLLAVAQLVAARPQTSDYHFTSTVSSTPTYHQASDLDFADLLGGVFNGFLGLLRGTTDFVTDIVAKDETLPKVADHIIDSSVNATRFLSDVGAEVIRRGPEVLEEKQSFVDGLGKTVLDTKGLVDKSVKELSQTLKIAGVFAKAYGESTLKQAGNFMEIFDKRFKCNTKCARLQPSDPERKACEELNCIDVNGKSESGSDDQYDYGDFDGSKRSEPRKSLSLTGILSSR